MQNKKILFVTALSVGSFGLALASGCSSSSSPAAPPAEGGTEDVANTSSGSSSGSSTSSSSGSAEAGGGFACANAAGCTAPQVCCLMLTGTTPGTVCAASPCPAIALLGGPVQICATAAECGAGMACGTPSNALLAMGLQAMMGKACIPGEGGAGGEGGTEGGTDGAVTHDGSAEGGSSGGDSGGTETGSDAPTGG